MLIEVPLDGLEVRLAGHAAVLENLNARFKEHKKSWTSVCRHALEDLLKWVLATQAENNPS